MAIRIILWSYVVLPDDAGFVMIELLGQVTSTGYALQLIQALQFASDTNDHYKCALAFYPS